MVREKSGNFALLKLWTPCLWLRGGGGGGLGRGAEGIIQTVHVTKIATKPIQ